MNAANGGAGIGIGGGRDRAGVEHNHLSFFNRFGGKQASLCEAAFYGGPIGLRGPASEILHKELSRHYV